MKFGAIIIKFVLLTILVITFFSCKKDKLITDSSATVHFSQDSVLFDTVFTSIGSSTRNIRVINKNNQKIKISNIQLQNGSSSQFIVNVDGAKGISFQDIEIAANDSMYIFIQVNINPGGGLPFIVSDKLIFSVNGNTQSVALEAWGQDAYYHRPTDAIKFKDGTYFAYSLISSTKNIDTTWANDKPHVIYGYLVVDSAQTLIINAGVRVYFNYKAALWVYRYGCLQVKGQKGNEVFFQGARREKDYADEPGQWDRIWINEGSVDNSIDYAIIKNGYIGVQVDNFYNDLTFPCRLKITNTKIQNMSLWGLYASGFNVYGGNNVISNCQEYSLNILLGGKYTFLHCTFANFWSKDKAREKPTVNINNYTGLPQVLPLDCYFGNCIIEGKLANEINLDLDYTNMAFQPQLKFSNCWLKTTASVTNTAIYQNDIRTGTSSVAFKDPNKYDFQLYPGEIKVKNFVNSQATIDAGKFPFDLNGPGSPRNTTSVSIGAYEAN